VAESIRAAAQAAAQDHAAQRVAATAARPIPASEAAPDA